MIDRTTILGISGVLLGAAMLSHAANKVREINSTQVRVVDGDTLALRNVGYVRLLGIDAPERGQICVPKNGSAPFDCGEKARYELQILVGRGEVKCVGRKTDPYSRLLAFCSVAGLDLSQEMIVRGLAIPYGEAAYRYTEDAQAAKSSHLGIYATFYDPPQLWRRANDRR